MSTQDVSGIANQWLNDSEIENGDATMGDYLFDSPELVWEAILALLKRDLTSSQMALLAAGPMEDLIVMHGDRFIGRIEQESESNQKLRVLLGGVWQRGIPSELWKRVERVRSVV